MCVCRLFTIKICLLRFGCLCYIFFSSSFCCVIVVVLGGTYLVNGFSSRAGKLSNSIIFLFFCFFFPTSCGRQSTLHTCLMHQRGSHGREEFFHLSFSLPAVLAFKILTEVFRPPLATKLSKACVLSVAVVLFRVSGGPADDLSSTGCICAHRRGGSRSFSWMRQGCTHTSHAQNVVSIWCGCGCAGLL